MTATLAVVSIKNVGASSKFTWLVHLTGDSVLVELETQDRLFADEREAEWARQQLEFRSMRAEFGTR